MASSWPCHCTILFALVIVLSHCGASNVQKKSKHMDEQRIDEVHHAVSQLLEQKIGKKLKEAENEVKHAVDKALDKHLHNAHHIMKLKDADVIIMDPKLSKLVKTAVKEGKKEHKVRDHHNRGASHGSPPLGSQSHGPVGYPNPGAYPGYPTSSDFSGYPSSQGYPGSPSYPSSRGYAASPGYPVSPGYPTSPGYPASPGYPQNPGYTAAPGVPASPGYPASLGQYSGTPGSPGGPGYPQMPGMQEAAYQGLGVPPPPSIMGGGCPQPCNQNCYSFCPKKCCGGDKRMKVAHHKITKKDEHKKKKKARDHLKGKKSSKGKKTK